MEDSQADAWANEFAPFRAIQPAPTRVNPAGKR